MESPARKVGRILVEIDIHEGLTEMMDIEWRGRHTKATFRLSGHTFQV
jgi:hypothetical protein